MIELTPLEQAVLAGSDASRNKALAVKHKAEQDAAKTAEREAATAAKVARDINDQADKQIHAIERQISDDAAALLEPLASYAPAFTPPIKHALVMHLNHLQRQDAVAEQRQTLAQRLADIDQQAADLEAKKLNLAAIARQNPQDKETLGRQMREAPRGLWLRTGLIFWRVVVCSSANLRVPMPVRFPSLVTGWLYRYLLCCFYRCFALVRRLNDHSQRLRVGTDGWNLSSAERTRSKAADNPSIFYEQALQKPFLLGKYRHF